jgi:hypothetical protein
MVRFCVTGYARKGKENDGRGSDAEINSMARWGAYGMINPQYSALRAKTRQSAGTPEVHCQLGALSEARAGGGG